jgi:hypothetical protein
MRWADSSKASTTSKATARVFSLNSRTYPIPDKSHKAKMSVNISLKKGKRTLQTHIGQ